MSVVEQEVNEVVRESWPETASPKILQGKKALVTGGSRGIGRATVLALAEAGADVAINYHNCPEPPTRSAAIASEFGVRAQDLSGRYRP